MGCNTSSEEWPHDQQHWAIKNGKHLQVQNNNEVKSGQEALEKYIELDEEIAQLQASSPTTLLKQKKDQIEQITKKIESQEELISTLELNTSKEKQDVDELEAENSSTRQLFLEAGQLEEAKAKEMQEYLDAKNKEEIAKADLKSLQEQYESLKVEVNDLEGKSGKLDQLYSEQDAILDKVFGGAYGSERENSLESELDALEMERHRIVDASYKWQQAQVMTSYAYEQLKFACKKWLSIKEIDQSELETRYGIAAETRNNLVAAAQNINGAQGYLSHVTFPYCAPEEVSTLNRATSYIFTDMQTSERLEHAYQCYNVTEKRCGALLHWITQVLKSTIQRDLSGINVKVREAFKALREERVKLIREKAKEVLGRDVEISLKDVDTDVNVKPDFNQLVTTNGIDPVLLSTLSESELESILNNDEMAPPPSQEMIFGEAVNAKINELTEDQKRLQELQQEDAEEVKRKLEGKLAARRQRRARKALDQKEAEHLKQSS